MLIRENADKFSEPTYEMTARRTVFSVSIDFFNQKAPVLFFSSIISNLVAPIVFAIAKQTRSLDDVETRGSKYILNRANISMISPGLWGKSRIGDNRQFTFPFLHEHPEISLYIGDAFLAKEGD